MVALPVDFVRHVLSFPAHQVWTEYDEDADVLYISFRKPQSANDSIMQEDGSIYHYDDDRLVGITVLNASKSLSSESHSP